MSMIKLQVSSFFLHIGKPRNGKSIMEAKGQIQAWYGTPSNLATIVQRYCNYLEDPKSWAQGKGWQFRLTHLTPCILHHANLLVSPWRYYGFQGCPPGQWTSFSRRSPTSLRRRACMSVMQGWMMAVAVA